MQRIYKRPASAVLSLALVLALVVPALADHLVTVPTGTVIPLRMDTYLSSDSSRVGDRFTATVFRDVTVNGRVVVPVGAKVEGHVTGTTAARRGSQAGTIAVAFDRLVLTDGSSIPVDGTLTTLSEEGRRQIENDSIDNEDRVEGGSRTRRAIVFIGGGAGAGAIIGAVAGGAKGAAVGAGVGAILGTIGVLLSKGDPAEVRPGTEFGMMVERSFTVDTDRLGVAGDRDVRDSYDQDMHERDTGLPQRTVFTSPESIRYAQIVLRDRGYYNGPIDGRMSVSTRNALRAFQRDRNLAISGDLDLRTAQELGIATETGLETSAIEISNVRAERVDNDSIRIYVDVHTRGGGWQVFTNHFVSGNTLHVYVRGVPPRSSTGTAIDHHPFNQVINNVPNVTRVIFHGPQRDITVDLSGSIGGGVGGINIGNARQIAFLANRLLQSYQRDLNVRMNRGQVLFDSRRNLSQSEADLLLQLYSLRAAADVYSQMTTATDPDVLRGAADSLLRQVRLTNRLINRGVTLSTIVRNDWEQFRNELRNVNLTDTDLDRDIIR
ncbi:MAG TPA: peptidoglycan-binding protein [Blastocatellia bacterium]|nr:peptidoglycan-binding protein [Blastocatellia bacterium]